MCTYDNLVTLVSPKTARPDYVANEAILDNSLLELPKYLLKIVFCVDVNLPRVLLL